MMRYGVRYSADERDSDIILRGGAMRCRRYVINMPDALRFC